MKICNKYNLIHILDQMSRIQIFVGTFQFNDWCQWIERPTHLDLNPAWSNLNDCFIIFWFTFFNLRTKKNDLPWFKTASFGKEANDNVERIVASFVYLNILFCWWIEMVMHCSCSCQVECERRVVVPHTRLRSETTFESAVNNFNLSLELYNLTFS